MMPRMVRMLGVNTPAKVPSLGRASGADALAAAWSGVVIGRQDGNGYAFHSARICRDWKRGWGPARDEHAPLVI